MQDWLAEVLRVARPEWGRLCLNVPLDRDLGGWQPVSADAIHVARAVGWQFRTWVIWDKDQAGAGTDRGSIDSAGARMSPRSAGPTRRWSSASRQRGTVVNGCPIYTACGSRSAQR